MTARILLIDDEPSIRLSVGDALKDAGYVVDLAADGAEGLEKSRGAIYDVVISDIRLPKLDGLAIFRHLRAESPETDVILITAYGAIEDAVSALKEGASDYLTKPIDVDELVVRVGRSAERRALKRELENARRELAAKDASEIIGRAPAMIRLLDRIDTVSQSDAPALITGESGSGKELVARRLHALSPRRDRPFVAVNCAAFPETLLEAELFGHERGAFTGAVKRREGRFKAAHGGTLFLDEIAELPPTAQAKLLRVLQEGVVEPLGTNAAVHVDVRLISATHQNLKERIATKLFREDLYYRLNVLDLPIPALRDRKSDLPILVEHFLRTLTPSNKTPPAITPRAWAALSGYAFPGNVRELQHIIERALVLGRGEEIDLHHLSDDVAGAASVRGGGASVEEPVDVRPGTRPLAIAMKEFEREYLARTLAACAGRKAKAADALGISRKNLWEKLRSHGLGDGLDGEDRP